MWFWIVAGAVCVALAVVYWWASGRSGRIDARRRLIQSDAYTKSEETWVRFDPGGPFS
jgi:hypothetical protein